VTDSAFFSLFLSLSVNLIVGNESQRLTRPGNIVLGLRETKSAQNSVFYEGVKMYNLLSVRIKQCDGLRTFDKLREYILNTIQYV